MRFRIPFVVFFTFIQLRAFLFASPTPMSCSETTRLCTSFLALSPIPPRTLAEIQSMFDILPVDVTVEENSRGYLFIKKNCSCMSAGMKYMTNTTFTVRKEEGSVNAMVTKAYGGLALLPNSNRRARIGAVVSLHLLCGCSTRLWNYLISYVMGEGDTVESLASRFGVSMDSIEAANGISNPDEITVGDVYYIPLNSVPGVPFPKATDMPPAPSPPPSIYSFSVSTEHHSVHFKYGWILGSMGVAIMLIIVALFIFVFYKSLICSIGSHSEDSDGKKSIKFHILMRTSFCNGSRRHLCCKCGTWKQVTGNVSDHHKDVSRDDKIPTVVTDGFDVGKPVVFSYEEILSSTDGFSDTNLLGHGTYGSMYYAFLRDQDVAIKRMTATKTKEFMAEMRVLCKVHHKNLVELIGYAASDDELFLVYEYAHRGSLKSHLHDPQYKDNTSLSWIARVQIALDAARGLEYIHKHTKTHYVHRDIKTSNILLDGAFRGKISDFGLAKLVGKTGEVEASVTRIVGTFGYLAPEYLSDGLATAKSDVYAFGVVIFELISGKEAIMKTESKAFNPERRSLVSIMLTALRNCPSSMSMGGLKECIDPRLMDLYPLDCVYKMAMLAKQCVDEDPLLRPDMEQVVICLSQVTLSSAEWEATLAGNSQVFSGLVQGR